MTPADEPNSILEYSSTALTGRHPFGIDWRRCLNFAGLGLGYGLLLMFVSFLAAGIGHGTYTVMGLCSSPLGLFGSILIALFGIPVVWCCIGILLAMATPSCRWALLAFPGVMLLHYLALASILATGEFADWGYVRRVQEMFWGGIFLYLAGQAGIWLFFVARLRRHPHGCANP